jgi:hypothetical protein
MSAKAKRHITYGNDCYESVDISGSNKANIVLTYWDLWILIILVDECQSKFNVLINKLKQIGKTSHYLSRNTEAIVNHTILLEKSIEENNLDIENIIFQNEPDFLKKQRIKANTKIIKMGFREEEKSRWMIETPRYLRRQKALYGHWDKFPINPLQYTPFIHRSFKKKTGYSRSQTSGLVDKLINKTTKLVRKASKNECIAIYRAALTVLLEHIDSIDDSYGEYGTLYGDLFSSYVNIDRTEFSSTNNIFLLDVLELILVEDYGGIDGHLESFIRDLSPQELSLAKIMLSEESEKLRKLDLNYYYKKSSNLLKLFLKRG